MINGKPFIIIALCLAALVASCSPPEEPGIQRAKEWIELGDNERARVELQTVISEHPRHLEARVLIATTYLDDAERFEHRSTHAIRNALSYLEESNLIQPENAQTKQVHERALRIINYKLASNNANEVASGLELASQLLDRNLLTGLAAAMANPAEQTASRARYIALAIDESFARNRLVELMSHDRVEVSLRSATFLWETYRLEEARELARSAYFSRLVSASSSAEASSSGAALRTTSISGIEQELTEFVTFNFRSRSTPHGAITAFELLGENSPNIAMSIIRIYYGDFPVDQIAGLACSSFGRTTIRFLGGRRDAETRQILRTLFSRYLVHESQRTPCRSDLEQALTRSDGRNWSNMLTYYRGGWGVFPVMVPGRISSMRNTGAGSNLAYSGSRWELFEDQNSLAASRIRRLMSVLGEYNPFRGGREIAFGLMDVDCQTPEYCLLTFDIEERGRARRSVGSLQVGVASTGAYREQPWAIREVLSLDIDGRSLMD